MWKRKSAAAVWAGHVQKAMNAEMPMPSKTATEIEADIAAISKELIGPMHPACRLDLIEHRAVLRKQLASLKPVT